MHRVLRIASTNHWQLKQPANVSMLLLRDAKRLQTLLLLLLLQNMEAFPSRDQFEETRTRYLFLWVLTLLSPIDLVFLGFANVLSTYHIYEFEPTCNA